MLKALLVRITPFRMSKGIVALCPLLSFHGSNILNAAIHNIVSTIEAEIEVGWLYCMHRTKRQFLVLRGGGDGFPPDFSRLLGYSAD